MPIRIREHKFIANLSGQEDNTPEEGTTEKGEIPVTGNPAMIERIMEKLFIQKAKARDER